MIKTKTEQKKDENKPIFTAKSGAVKGAVFKNVKLDSKTGEQFETFSFSIQKAYTDDDGKTFKYTSSFSERDVDKVFIVTQEIFKFLRLNENE